MWIQLLQAMDSMVLAGGVHYGVLLLGTHMAKFGWKFRFQLKFPVTYKTPIVMLLLLGRVQGRADSALSLSRVP